MSVVALASAKGSPGVTTLAHRVGDVLARRERQARRAPRPVVLVEADVAGGDLAARRGLPGAPGLASLALSARRAFGPETVLDHCQQLGAVGVLVGVAGCRQGLVVAPVLGRALDALAEADAVVVLDVGRLGPPLLDDPSLLRRADPLCLVTRTSAECAVHARSAVDALRAHGLAPELVLVGRPEYRADAVAAAVGAPVLGSVAHSPVEAATDPRRPLRGRRGDLARSVETLADLLLARMAKSAALGDSASHASSPLIPEPAPGPPAVVHLRALDPTAAPAGDDATVAPPASSA